MGVLPLKSGSYNAEQGRGGMPMDNILQVNERLRGLIWGAPMLILLLGTGLYFTAVTGVFQVRYCALWLRKTLFSCFTGAARRTSGGVSPFAAMCTALAATVGTGNIAGVATALTLGGPGAVFWLWVSAFVGMMTAFAENTLGMLYREKGCDGSWRGGAMLYLKNGLRSPLLAGAFALFCVLASFGIGNMSQCNSIAQGLYSSFGISSGIVGTVTAVLLGAVLLGGLKRLSRVTETLVPFMALFYMAGCVVILCINHAAIIPAFKSIFVAAFDPQSILGGAAGITVREAMRYGVARGLFSNEAGMGSTPHAHALANVDCPHDQGVVAMIGVFIDTFVVLTLNALVIISTLYTADGPLASGYVGDITGVLGKANLAQTAFGVVFGESAGNMFVAVCLFFFAFSTILSWNLFGKINMVYLFGKKSASVYTLLALIFIFLGTTMSNDLVWELSDMLNQLMVIPNAIALLALTSHVVKHSHTPDRLSGRENG